MINVIKDKKIKSYLSASSLVVLGLVIGAAPRTASAQTVRPAVGKPLQQAELLINQHDYDAALRKIQQASEAGHLTQYEIVTVAQLRGAAAAGAGDNLQAATAFETVLAAGSEPPATRLQLTQAIAGFYYSAQDDKNAELWVNNYIAAGGNDLATQGLLAQSYYRQGDYTRAEQAAWQETKKSDKNLPESTLQLLANAAQKSGDAQGYWDALKILLSDYPSQAYWTQAIGLVVTSNDFPDSLTLDAYRLRRATGTLTAPGEYEDYTERAILANQPQEASLVINLGFSTGILNDGTDSGHAERLQSLAAKNSQNFQAGPNGFAQDGLDKGIALAAKGDSIDAIHAFESVLGYNDGHDAEVKLAQLWVIEEKGVRN